MLATQGVLKDAGLGKEAIDEVVLVGGSTRIPAIRAALSAFFGGAPLPSRFLAPPSSGPLHCVAGGGRGRPGPQPDNEGFAAGRARVSRSRIGFGPITRLHYRPGGACSSEVKPYRLLLLLL